MDLTKIKLVVADMDGTLLNGMHELGPDFYPLFYKMKEKGLLFAAASGRQFFNLENCLERVKTDIIFIAENGSYVSYQNEDILVQAMSAAVVKDLLIIARQIPGANIILCGKKCAYVESELPEFIANVKMYYGKYKIVSDLLKLPDDHFLKIAICDLKGAEQNSYHFFGDRQDELQVKISGHIWLDLSDKLANKGRAIQLVQQKFHITVGETMVFGDYLNDLEMMGQGAFSYAMENAHPDIKKAARYLTKSNDENGVTIVLHQLLDALEDPGRK